MASNYSRKSASSGSRNARPQRRARSDTRQQANRRTSGRGSQASRASRVRRGQQGPARQDAHRTVRRNRGAVPSAESRVHTAPTQRRVSSVRLGDLQNGRGARMESRYRRYTRKVLVGLGIFAAIVLVYAILYFSGMFAIKNVTVKGCEHLTAEEVSSLAAVPKNSTLLRVDSAGICSRLETNPWVQDASVTAVFPDTLEIDITERTIDAVVEVTTAEGDATEDWAIASDGMWLMSIPDKNSEEASQVSSKVYEDADNVLHITDVPYGVSPVAGSYCTDDSVKNALNIVSGMTTELADQVKSVKADSSDNATLTLKNGVEIAFGSDDDIREKERICLELLDEHQGSIAYINVRTPSNPTYRAL
ncbi:MAG: FtsQ-type POTRA domain-containing protein [Eggerthellaceae bacterium]|jgi:cell division protein FtsQ